MSIFTAFTVDSLSLFLFAFVKTAGGQVWEGGSNLPTVSDFIEKKKRKTSLF